MAARENDGDTATGAVQAPEVPRPVERACVLYLHPEALRRLLQLPEGAVIDHVHADAAEYGLLTCRIRGAGWPVVLGERLQEVRPTIHVEEGGRYRVEWGFPS